jgi:hypothetical protein
LTVVLLELTLLGMKLSVSVPDELWNEARSLAQDSTTSAVVQEALRRWVNQAHPKPQYVEGLPEDVLAALRETRGRLGEEAHMESKRGYVYGVETAQRLPWWAIESLADHYRFDVREWAKDWARTAFQLDMTKPPADPQDVDKAIKRRRPGRRPGLFDWTHADAAIRAEAEGAKDASPDPYVVIRALIPALGILVPPYGDDSGFAPSTTYLQGFTQAMRDLWSSVTEGLSGGAS